MNPDMAYIISSIIQIILNNKIKKHTIKTEQTKETLKVPMSVLNKPMIKLIISLSKNAVSMIFYFYYLTLNISNNKVNTNAIKDINKAK